MEKPKILTSNTKIRFQDCDPFNHLNNGRYIDYFLNQREDQVLNAYGIDIFKMIREEKIGWVVSSTQIAYILPVFTMEEIAFESQTIEFSKKHMKVEMRMFNKQKNQLKALAWMTFVHVDLTKNKTTEHHSKLMQLFNEVVLPLEEKSFDARERNVRMTMKNS
ncbi:thioesterase family protein [Wenyingzhuangia sp. 2_MG-2023]|uniref:acyl-CoA thioesterase n=1 Tax=Wenyingzhuangia sp. 2_MG-2023 TaxID=3062639 RepID=UPI0026E2637F|nr:acyl-CoA thioesterase [Wenyingzhuangia sp. 2_MG-2023]MDO6737537.1 acyl-CoA thioesterase [Wenyingzhuangia sp. 2_MG-2023]MDO6802840.1 acyl-CoA thioesterase [Wenyingzhuangia sp. 1_MG-2023]